MFVKYPVKGQVKTRLATQIGQEKALRLYEKFVLDTLTLLKDLDIPVHVFFDPTDAEKQYKEWLGNEYTYIPQSGADLGQRMKNAFINSFEEGYKKVILIGSDIPDLPVEFLSEALDALESNDVAIGPSSDGGYYLIGFTRTSFLPIAFDNITWSTSTVCRKTLEIITNNKLNVYLLKEWSDVDSEVDLQSLWLRNRVTPFRNSKTYCFLTAEGMWSTKHV